MRAILLIFGADPFLLKAVEPFISLDTETIHWDQINKVAFGSGHRAAVTWAYGIWTDQQRPRANAFDSALSMSPMRDVMGITKQTVRLQRVISSGHYQARQWFMQSAA